MLKIENELTASVLSGYPVFSDASDLGAHESSAESVERKVNQILAKILRVSFAFLSAVAVITTSLDASRFGWSAGYIAMTTTLALFPPYALLAPFVIKNEQLELTGLLTLVGLTAAASFYAMGPFSGGFILLALFPMACLFLQPLRFALIEIGIFIALTVIIAWLHAQQAVQLITPGLSYPDSFTDWFRVIFFTYLISLAFSYVGLTLKKSFLLSLMKLKNSETDLVGRERELGAILDNLPEVYYRADLTGVIVMAKGAVQKLAGITPESALGMRLSDFYVDPSLRDVYLQQLAANEGVLSDHRALIRQPSGKLVWTSSNSRYWRDADGKILGVEGTIRDITEQVESQEKIREKDREIRAIFDNSPDVFFRARVDGTFIMVSPSVKDLIGYDAESLIGRKMHDFFEDPALFAPFFETLSKRKTFSEIRNVLKHKDGHKVYTTASASLWVDELGRPLGMDGYVHNSTELVKANHELMAREAELRVIFETMLDTYLQTDSEGRVKLVSPSVESLLGYAAHEVLGTQLADYFADHESKAVSGRLFGADPVLKALEVSMIRKDGSFVRVSVGGYRNEEGGISAVFRDVTEQRRNEQALQSAKRFEAIGKLTGGIAHDFNNLLALISTNAEMLQSVTDGQSGIDAISRSIERSVARGTALTKRLLAYSRKQPLAPELIDINELIRENTEVWSRTLGGNITVGLSLADFNASISADRNQLEDALINLFLNAKDALSTGGDISVSTSVVEGHHISTKIAVDAGDSQYVAISIQDNGVGMSPEVLEHAFEPFFTTKAIGEGTGMGLSMVYGFVKQSHGFVAIDSVPGAGCRVELFFPALHLRQSIHVPKVNAVPVPEPNSDLSRLRIVYVEDNRELQQTTLRFMLSLTENIVVFDDARSALDWFESGQDSDILFTDIMLPGGVDGVELSRLAIRMIPRLRVIFTTGYTEKYNENFVTDAQNQVLLPKPYKLASLRELLSSFV